MEVTIIKIKIGKDGVIYYNTNPNTDVWYSDLSTLLKEITHNTCDVMVSIGFNLIDTISLTITVDGLHDKYIALPKNSYLKISKDLVKVKIKKSFMERIKDIFTILFTTKEVVVNDYVPVYSFKLLSDYHDMKHVDKHALTKDINDMLIKIFEHTITHCNSLKNIGDMNWTINVDFEVMPNEQ